MLLDGYMCSIKMHEADIFSTFTSLLTPNTDNDVFPFNRGLKKARDFFVKSNTVVFKKYGLDFFFFF